MAGGTSVPPQDSQCEPWSGKEKIPGRKRKTCDRTKRSRRSNAAVSLDNADAVIEGAPPFIVGRVGGFDFFLGLITWPEFNPRNQLESVHRGVVDRTRS